MLHSEQCGLTAFDIKQVMMRLRNTRGRLINKGTSNHRACRIPLYLQRTQLNGDT